MLTSFTLSDRVYLWVKNLTMIILPALATAYLSLSDLWDLPSPEKVTATSAVVCTLLGALLKLSTRNYNASGAQFDGNLVVSPSEAGGILASIEPDVAVEDLMDRDSITLKITQGEPTTDL